MIGWRLPDEGPRYNVIMSITRFVSRHNSDVIELQEYGVDYFTKFNNVGLRVISCCSESLQSIAPSLVH